MEPWPFYSSAGVYIIARGLSAPSRTGSEEQCGGGDGAALLGARRGVVWRGRSLRSSGDTGLFEACLSVRGDWGGWWGCEEV